MKLSRRDFLATSGAALAGSSALVAGVNQLRAQSPDGKSPDGKSTDAPAADSSGPYTPVITPNGATMPWVMKDGAKEFHIIAEPVQREFAPGMTVNCWGYNGQTPGPTIEAVEGDRVRLL